MDISYRRKQFVKYISEHSTNKSKLQTNFQAGNVYVSLFFYTETNTKNAKSWRYCPRL